MLEKLILHLAASQLTQGIMSQVPEQDPMKRQIIACQVEVNYYEWLRNTLVDANWPTPVINPAWWSSCRL